MKKFLSAFICTLPTLIAFSQENKNFIQLTDMLKIKTIGNVSVSNDGSKAAFTVTSIEPDERSKGDYKYVTQLYTADMASASAPVQLTYARESSSSPAWSPDGKSLAFVRAVDGKPQIFVMPINGGEAWQLTKGMYGAFNPKWSPDGSRIVFSSSVQMKDLLKDSTLNPARSYPLWPSEKPGVTYADMQRAAKAKANPDGSMDEVRAYLLSDEADGKATVLNKLNFQDENNITSSQSFTQFFTVDAKLNSEAKPILAGFSRYGNVEFTPDGKRLIITADIDSLEHPDRSEETEIYIADADGKNLKLLLGQKGMGYNGARLSPSGKWLAYFYGPVEGDVPTLAIMPLAGTEADAINIPMDRSKGNLAWSLDEKHLYFIAQSNGGAPLYRVAMSTKKVEQLSDFNGGITSVGIGRDKIIFTKTEVASPSELYTADLVLKAPVKLGGFNDWVKEKKTFAAGERNVCGR